MVSDLFVDVGVVGSFRGLGVFPTVLCVRVFSHGDTTLCTYKLLGIYVLSIYCFMKLQPRIQRELESRKRVKEAKMKWSYYSDGK